MLTLYHQTVSLTTLQTVYHNMNNPGLVLETSHWKSSQAFMAIFSVLNLELTQILWHVCNSGEFVKYVLKTPSPPLPWAHFFIPHTLLLLKLIENEQFQKFCILMMLFKYFNHGVCGHTFSKSSGAHSEGKAGLALLGDHKIHSYQVVAYRTKQDILYQMAVSPSSHISVCSDIVLIHLWLL